MSKQVLVTGGAGFLGSHLCERLLSEGLEVLCVDNFYTGAKQHVAQLLDSPYPRPGFCRPPPPKFTGIRRSILRRRATGETSTQSVVDPATTKASGAPRRYSSTTTVSTNWRSR